MPVEITINDSFTNKTNPEAYSNAIRDTVSEVSEKTMEECQAECPVRTGNLRDSHSVESDGMEATIRNSAEYWIYVVYGTSRMSANNYPQRAWNTIISQDVIGEIFKSKLNENGIDTG
ncbi:HK97 gp10 family phage protein [Methanobrevibacter sp.]|jgi:hypothetical protein|uniref:HK97 gp10 family phage protein n=1 Tax=Methanobrevibacter sp. TaxID=66852 RepID=UPI003869AC3E